MEAVVSRKGCAGIHGQVGLLAVPETSHKLERKVSTDLLDEGVWEAGS